MPGAPQAKFEFVATGDAAVNAQIEGVVNKLVRMRQQARDTQESMAGGVEKTRATIHLLNDDLGLHLPRALQTVLAKLPAVQTAFAGLLSAAAISVGAKVLFDVIGGVVDKVREYHEEQEKLTNATTVFGTTVNKVFNHLKEKLLEAQIKADELNHNHIAALHHQLQLINQQSFDALIENFGNLAKAADDAFGKIKSHFYDLGGAAGAQHSLNEFMVQYNALLAQPGREKEAADFLAKKLKDEQHILELQKKAQTIAKGTNPEFGGPSSSILQELQERGARFTAKDIQAQQILVNTLQAQVRVQQELNSLKDTQSKNAKSENAKAVQAETDEIQLTLQRFRDNTSGALAKATEEMTDDPLQKAQQKVRDGWNKIINEYNRSSAELIKILKAKGIDTTKLIAEQNKTVIALLAARGKAEADQERKNQIERLSAFGMLGHEKIPGTLFVSNEDKTNLERADYLLKQINDDLAAEAAKEAELKDKALATGETQIDLEKQLGNLRAATADKTQNLVDQLMMLARSMHDGIGDPALIAQAEKLESKLESLRIKTKTWQLELKQTLKTEMQGAFVGVVSGTETVSQAFQRMARSILAELAKIIYQMYIVKLLQVAIGGFFGGGGAATSAGSGVGSVGAGASSFNSGLSGLFPGHAMGGPILSGMTYLVGERGPELLTMGAGGYVTPNHMIGQGGKAPVINIHNYGPPMETSQSSRFDGEQFVVDVVVRNIQNNGPIRQQLR